MLVDRLAGEGGLAALLNKSVGDAVIAMGVL